MNLGSVLLSANAELTDAYRLAALILFRLLNALVINTLFDIDEFFQAQEVAHHAVFGYGTLTWEWSAGIRSFAYPSITAIAYWLLKITQTDNNPLLLYCAPRLVQALFAATSDFYLYKLANSQLTSHFLFFSLTRTLSNSLEQTLTIAALFYFPLGSSVASYHRSLLLFGIATVIRPTALVTLILTLVIFNRLTLQDFILSSVLPSLSILVASITLDSLYASKLSLPLVNFLYLNVFKDIASFYGTHPWHWYVSNAIPVTLATHIPFVVHGVIIGDRRLSYLAAGVVTVLSLIGHKEFRFLLPILPLLFCYAGVSLEAIDRFREKKEREVRERINEKRQKRNVMSRINLALLFILSTNTAAAFYLTQIHQRGVIDVVFYLKHRLRLEPDQKSVFFLMPCHSTPLQTILHDSSIQIKTLSCEPPLRDDTVDESALFYDDKRGYLKEVEQHAWQYIVMFEVLDADSDVKQWMDGWYSFDKRFFNTHWHWDGKRKGDVVVYKRIT